MDKADADQLDDMAVDFELKSRAHLCKSILQWAVDNRTEWMQPDVYPRPVQEIAEGDQEASEDEGVDATRGRR